MICNADEQSGGSEMSKLCGIVSILFVIVMLPVVAVAQQSVQIQRNLREYSGTERIHVAAEHDLYLKIPNRFTLANVDSTPNCPGEKYSYVDSESDISIHIDGTIDTEDVQQRTLKEKSSTGYEITVSELHFFGYYEYSNDGKVKMCFLMLTDTGYSYKIYYEFSTAKMDEYVPNEALDILSSCIMKEKTLASWPIRIDEYFAVVNNPDPQDRLHLRAEPDKNSLSLGKYYNGVRVVIHGSSINGYTPVSIEGTRGYMKTEYLVISGEGHPYPPAAMPWVQLGTKDSSEEEYLFSEPSSTAHVLGEYPDGAMAVLMGFDSEWAHIIINGMTGYIPLKYLK